MAIQPFRIQIPDAALDDLRRRLAHTRWPDALEGVGWDYGADLAYLRGLCAHWADGYDWRAQEAALNRFHHFRAEVGGEGLHVLHERNARSDAPAVVLLHGWPGSFYQMVKLVPLLTADYHVIVPSLPGYGFSDPPRQPGMSVARMAERLDGLLTELGYARVAIRAGDIGAGVAREFAVAHPERVIGLHQTGLYPDSMEPPPDASPAERDYLKRVQQWAMVEGAYAMEQATKPQTLTYGLNDSPAGLAAWLVEKYRAWSDCGGDVERRFPRDELLTHLSVYWLTGTIGSSVRVYRESMGRKMPGTGKHLDVPTAFAQTPADLVPGPREFAERTYRVVRWTELPRGGHFAEWEEPALVADDFKAFLGSLPGGA